MITSADPIRSQPDPIRSQTGLSPLQPETPAALFEPLAVMVAAWDQDRTVPGTKHLLGVTVTNRGDQDAVVQVRLETTEANKPIFAQWCSQPEQWLALSRSHGGEPSSGELTFCIEVPSTALPQWLDYEVVVRPQSGYQNLHLASTACRLQVLAPDNDGNTSDPTFALTPETTPERPIRVTPGALIEVQLKVNNRSERVDRFQVKPTGLPEDWTVEVLYPQDFTGLGLVRQADGLGLNPGDSGTIQVRIQPPPLPLAGSYLPTFQMVSDNAPDLGLLGLVYLRVDPTYQLQAQINPIHGEVVDRRPAEFQLQLANLGNTPRLVQFNLIPLTPPQECVYTVPSDRLTIAPQSTAQMALTARPQSWWKRPWLKPGKVYPFELRLADLEKLPLDTRVLKADLTWQPRPWWQLLLAGLAGLGVVGGAAFALWWFFLRPPAPPTLLEFAAEDSRYAAANQDMARVRWQIERPERVQSVTLTGYDPEGAVKSGPLVYEFTGGKLPAALQPFCTQQKTILNCSQIRTDAFQPGKYIFELTVKPKGNNAQPQSLKTTPVEILPSPLPTVTELQPTALVYREFAAGKPTPAEARLPVADASGVKLNWTVTRPEDLEALQLIGRSSDGKIVGDFWFEFKSAGQLPDLLKRYCRLEANLVCRNVPTGLAAVGEYQFELRVVTAGQPADQPAPGGNQAAGAGGSAAKPLTTEVVKIQAKMPQLVSFQINGKEAPAKLLIPYRPNQTPPTVDLAWRVQGGQTTLVELSPSPGNVPPAGRLKFQLSGPSSSTLTLKVKLPSGDFLTRSVTLEVFDPNPKDPAVQAIQAVQAANAAAARNQAAAARAAGASGAGQSGGQQSGGQQSGASPQSPGSSTPPAGAASNPPISPAEDQPINADGVSPAEYAPQLR